MTANFSLESAFRPTGDQPLAIEQITSNFGHQKNFQTLLGVTGSGKTFAMANIIKNIGKKTLILAPNKTLAAQLFAEFKEFFPHNAVEYFVSYYDYYQPEAYVPGSDTYIEKDSAINDEIEKLRHSTTRSLFAREDVIVVASVSCIYGIGSPEEYFSQRITLLTQDRIERDELLRKLVDNQYQRNDIDFHRGTFRVRETSSKCSRPTKTRRWFGLNSSMTLSMEFSLSIPCEGKSFRLLIKSTSTLKVTMWLGKIK